jgi:transcriptional regulator with XRE-family HTH domain
MDSISIFMDKLRNDVNRRIAAQTRELRAGLALSLEALASRSGVSRSMISLIERGEASPTAVVLERLAWGLRVPLARLFDPPAGETAAPQPVVRRVDQLQWRDPASGYVRRNLSPPHWPSPLQMVEVEFPAGARVAYETGSRDPPVHQQVWVLSGTIQLTLGSEQYRLDPGDCLAMLLDRPVVYANRTRHAARYVVVVGAEAPLPRRAV